MKSREEENSEKKTTFFKKANIKRDGIWLLDVLDSLAVAVKLSI